MKQFTDETLKELTVYLNHHYGNDNNHVSDIIEAIDEWAEEHDIENNIVVDSQYCRKEEITNGLWEYVGVDAVYENEYDNRYFIIEITAEGGGICVYVTHEDEDDPF